MREGRCRRVVGPFSAPYNPGVNLRVGARALLILWLAAAGAAHAGVPCPSAVVGAAAFAPLRPAQETYRETEVLSPDTDEWEALPAEDAGTPGGALAEARRLLAVGEPRKARKLLEDWTEAHPDDERYVEARYLLGEANFERKDYWAAYEQYEYVVENTSGDLFYKALAREMDVARAFLSGEPRIVWKILRIPAYDDGIEILDRVWERVPGTRMGEVALKLKADYRYAWGEMDLAQDEYAHLAREYPNGRYIQLALLRTAEAALASYPGSKYDDRSLVEAQERFEQLRRTFSVFAERQGVDQRLEGIREQRAEQDLEVARWYERVRRPDAAIFYYKLVLQDWPDTLAAGEARGRLRALGVELEAEGEAGG